jgi:hypothetical protein
LRANKEYGIYEVVLQNMSSKTIMMELDKEINRKQFLKG